MFSLSQCYIVDYTYFPKSQMIAINHEINCLLKKLNFSVLWRQRQNILRGLISQLFGHGSFDSDGIIMKLTNVTWIWRTIM